MSASSAPHGAYMAGLPPAGLGAPRDLPPAAGTEGQIGQARAAEPAARLLWPIGELGLAKRLHRITCPTWLVWGAEDRIVIPVYGENWPRAIPNARLELITGAGHVPHWEQPEAFVDQLAAFVEGNR